MSRRAVVTGAGGPDVFRIVDETPAEPRANQVRVRVAIAGVAFGDVMRRRGVLAPRGQFTPGYDVAGVVEAVGSNAGEYSVGDRVAAMMPKPGIGGYADHVCLPVRRLVRVPADVPFDEAVCLGLNYITAYQLLTRVARVQAGSKVLIHGAAGGVGSALLDLGAMLGVTMYGTASAGKHEFVRERGGIPIDYRNQDFVARMAELEPDGVDAVFDGVGGANLRRSYQTLAARGMLISFGVSGDLDQGLRGVAKGMLTYLSLKLRLNRKRTRFYAITATPGAWPSQCRADWAELLELRRSGKLAPVVAAKIPLERVAEAHELIDRAGVIGKIVMTCAD